MRTTDDFPTTTLKPAENQRVRLDIWKADVQVEVNERRTKLAQSLVYWIGGASLVGAFGDRLWAWIVVAWHFVART